MSLKSVIETLARVYPWSVETSDDLEQSCRFLGGELSPNTVVSAGYGAAIGTAVCLAPLAAYAPRSLVPMAMIGILCIALGIAHLIHRAPVVAAKLRRTEALGASPGLVGRAVLRMRVDPAEEAAVEFASEAGNGPLADSLSRHVDRAAGRPESGLSTFAAEWRDWFPALSRAAHLLGAAGDAPAAQRERTLDRALQTVLEGTSDEMRTFVAEVDGPATAIYAFGVLLPLALVAVLPGARAAGVTVTLPMIVVLYDVLLPLALLGAAGWLLLRRPVAFPPPRVGRDHPDVPDRRWPAFAAGTVCAVGSAAGAGIVVAQWTWPLAAVGGGIGAGLIVWYRPIVRVRQRTAEIEAGLPDALYLIGRRVNEGGSVERGIERAAEELPGATGEILADAVRRQRVLALGIREALLGDRGALANLPSSRTESTASLLALAGREGRPAGHAVVSMADHLDELQAIEREARHELARVTGTLRNTAAVFGPLVAGATVALAEGMGDFDDGDEIATLSAEGLGLAVGAYVLLLAVVLVVLATALEKGFDRPTAGYRAGLALSSATAIFLAAYVGAGVMI